MGDVVTREGLLARVQHLAPVIRAHADAGKSATKRSTSSSKSKTKAKTSSAPAKDAVALLKADHREVEKLFGQFENVVTDRGGYFDHAVSCLGRVVGIPA